MNAEIIECRRQTSYEESSISNKINSLEINENKSFTKINKHDIVIKGLPSGLKCLFDVIINLGKLYDTSTVFLVSAILTVVMQF